MEAAKSASGARAGEQEGKEVEDKQQEQDPDFVPASDAAEGAPEDEVCACVGLQVL